MRVMLAIYGALAVLCGCHGAPVLDCDPNVAPTATADSDADCVAFCAFQSQNEFGFCDCQVDCKDRLRAGEEKHGAECEEAIRSALRCAAETTPSNEFADCAHELTQMQTACPDGRYYHAGWAACEAECEYSEACNFGSYPAWGDCYGECWSNLDIDAAQGCFAESIAYKECIVDQLESGCKSVKSGCKNEDQDWQACVSF
ncbi:hypothetical protein ENSA7_62910 [Enhygromyxa salina]|uniref:Lipoprotein n=1 Tax=Enhygromyxa salina TaxID=215803 RepID=A0A2S9Y3K9_9BACT|nr:hypothetical protein ENSA7_62910 [Enhygromyxa salina]